MRLLALLGPCTDHNDRFRYPFVYFSYRNPYPFIYLRLEKGTPVLAIIGNTSHHHHPLVHITDH